MVATHLQYFYSFSYTKNGNEELTDIDQIFCKLIPFLLMSRSNTVTVQHEIRYVLLRNLKSADFSFPINYCQIKFNQISECQVTAQPCTGRIRNIFKQF